MYQKSNIRDVLLVVTQQGTLTASHISLFHREYTKEFEQILNLACPTFAGVGYAIFHWLGISTALHNGVLHLDQFEGLIGNGKTLFRTFSKRVSVIWFACVR